MTVLKIRHVGEILVPSKRDFFIIIFVDRYGDQRTEHGGLCSVYQKQPI
jgi:hypothetical protein